MASETELTRLRATLTRLAPEESAALAARLFLTPQRHDRPAREAELLRTGTPLRLPGEVSAVAWGAGPPVLLTHGWEGRGAQLGAFVAPLVAAGRRPIALDGPAHGDTPGEETNPLGFARALLAVGAELGPLDGVVAHSFSVPATVLALDRGLAARRVVLIAGPASIPRVMDRWAAFVGLPPAVVPRFRERVAERVGLPADDLDIARTAARLRTPALIVHDPADEEVPYADGLALAASWPGARLLPVHGVGHRRILRDEATVREAVAFIAGAEDTACATPG